MHEAAATPAWVLLAYLIAGVCFILALRGLSGPESSRRGNRLGMIGMAIAVATTLAVHVPGSRVTPIATPTTFLVDWAALAEILAAVVIGGGIGLVTARKIQMTAMPQLVAVALASVNIFGGFAVTQRMLSMYRKKERKDA